MVGFKRGHIFVLMFVLMFVLLISFCSSYSCEIIEKSSCQDVKIMEISSLTNAHGALLNQGNYDYVLCCDFDFGSINQNSNNEILSLSSQTNAHIEAPGEPNYNYIIGYEGLECNSLTSCTGSYFEILSLSSQTNAHIGQVDDYSIKICCKKISGITGDECVNDSDCSEGEICKNGECVFEEECNDTCFSLGYECGVHEICNQEVNCSKIIGCNENAVCNSYGKCYLPDTCEPFCDETWECGSDGCEGSCGSCGNYGKCEVHQCITPVAHWEDMNGNYIDKINAIPNKTKVYLVVEDLVAFSKGDRISFQIFEKNVFPFTDDKITKLIAAVDEEKTAKQQWLISQENLDKAKDSLKKELDFYFEVYEGENKITTSGNLVTSPQDSNFCDLNGIAFCSHYNDKSTCEGDPCGVAEISVENNLDVNCGETKTGSDGCEYLTNCLCKWDNKEKQCDPAKKDVFVACPDGGGFPVDFSLEDIGICIQKENTTDNCEDGYKTYSWEGEYNWGSDNYFTQIPLVEGIDSQNFVQDSSEIWHYDPDRESENCVGEEGTPMRCPAELQVPFFSIFNILLVLLFVFGLYSLNEQFKKF